MSKDAGAADLDPKGPETSPKSTSSGKGKEVAPPPEEIGDDVEAFLRTGVDGENEALAPAAHDGENATLGLKLLDNDE